MGNNCFTFVPDNYDPHESSIVSEPLLHAADIVCCSTEMREAFIRFLINKTWLPKYLEHQKLGLGSALFDMPEGRTLTTYNSLYQHDTAAALYRAKSEMFRSKRTLSMNSESNAPASPTLTSSMPSQDPLLALAESFIIFLVAGVLPHFLVSPEFLEWTDSRAVTSAPNSPRNSGLSSILRSNPTSPRHDQHHYQHPRQDSNLEENKEFTRSSLFAPDHNGSDSSRIRSRRRSSITQILIAAGWTSSNPKRYFGPQSATLIKPILIGVNEQKVTPCPVSPVVTEVDDGVRAFSVDNSPRTTHLPPLTVLSPSSNYSSPIPLKSLPPLNGNNHNNNNDSNYSPVTPMNCVNKNVLNDKSTNKNTISIIPLNETLRMGRIIDDVLDAVNLSELDDMLRSTDWLRSLLQTLDDMPISVSIALHSTNDDSASGSEKYTMHNKKEMRSKRGLFGHSNSRVSNSHSSKSHKKTGKDSDQEEPQSVTASSLSTAGKIHSNTAAVVPFNEDEPVIGTHDIFTANFTMRHPLIYVNRAFEKMTLYHRDEVIGHAYSILEDPILTEKAQLRKLQQALSTLSCAKIGLTNVKQDGSLFFNLVSMKPLVYNRSSKQKHPNNRFPGGNVLAKEDKYCKYIVNIQYALEDRETPSYNELLAMDDLLRLLSNFLY